MHEDIVVSNSRGESVGRRKVHKYELVKVALQT
jgi:hypothetical protein